MTHSFSAREGSCKTRDLSRKASEDKHIYYLHHAKKNVRSSATPVVFRLDSWICISLCTLSWQEPCPERRLLPQRPHHFGVRPRHQSRETAEAIENTWALSLFYSLFQIHAAMGISHDLPSTTTGLHASFSWTGTALRRTNRRFFFFWSTCVSVF